MANYQLNHTGAEIDAAISAVPDLANDVNILNDFLINENSVALPDIIKGKYRIDFHSANDEVISGTQNVAQLLNIKQGNFSCNGVSVTVSGNTFTLSGTATGNYYYELQSAEHKTTAQLAAMTLPLPVHQYTLSQKVTNGTVYPSLFVRSKSSGNLVQAQNNTAQFMMDTSTCGGAYILIQSGKTYNCTFVIALLPYAATNANAYREQTSDIEVYTENGVYDLDGYTWSVGSPTLTELSSKISKKPICKYSTRTIAYTGATEILDIYIPAKNGYVNYIFGHTVSESTGGGNVWRLVQIDSVNDALAFQFHITQLGETEMAIKIKNRDDFIGGWTHGDETLIADSFFVVLDGASVDVTTLTNNTEFETLQIFLCSNMYDPDDHTTKVGEHGREWRFDKTGLLLDQTVKFVQNLTLTTSYMPMLCAIRGNDTVSASQITDTYIDDGNFQQYDVSVGGFTTYPNQLKSDVKSMHLFGQTSGVRASVELIEQPEGLNGSGTYVYNGENTYNKIYCCICGYAGSHDQNVSNGDKWRVKSKITVEVG